MNTERFSFALEKIAPTDWALFEKFASQFLILDYNSLRTVAAASGDLGRDSEIFSPEGDSTVFFQYSVRQDWSNKILATARRISSQFPRATILVYVTNQKIGAAADNLKKRLRNDYRLQLDIHDRSWFTDRLLTNQTRMVLAMKLAAEVVDPYLSGKGVVESKVPALTEFEAKAAVLHLQLQWEDDTREKGLTKLSFEALVKSVLRETSSGNRVRRQFIYDSIHNLLPSHAFQTVDIYIGAALKRLERHVIKHWPIEDEFCLSHEEVIKVRDGLAQKEVKDQGLMSTIKKNLSDFFEQPICLEQENELCIRARRILDQFLLKKGEEFALAVTHNRSININDDSIEILVTNDFAAQPIKINGELNAPLAIRLALLEVFQRSSKDVQAYLREIADGYTLFGFLRAVPDVQKAVQKVFSKGEIWLDTSVLLPVFAETLLDFDEQLVSRLLRAALDVGIKLRVTSGVIEEVERHLNRCRTYLRTADGSWIGGVPFIYAMFALGGADGGDFDQWIYNFCGDKKPREDIADYLKEEWGIELYDLDAEVEATDRAFRWEVERIWREAHMTRRNQGNLGYDDYVIDRLVKHDVECHLGVLGKRESDTSGDLGYSHWWLTFDKTIRDFNRKLRESLGDQVPQVPVMSPDFLANYIAIGPVRSLVGKSGEASIPVAFFDMLHDHVPRELLDIAEAIRKQTGTGKERLLRRKLRDTLDTIKRTEGVLSKGGFSGLKDHIEKTLLSRQEG